MASIYQMDGTRAGIQKAHTIAASGPIGTAQPSRYNFSSTPVGQTQTTYSTQFSGTYVDYSTATLPATNQYAFIKVTSTATIPVSFLVAIPGIPKDMTISATAIAGQMAKNAADYGGISPFMPDAHDPSDTVNFGFVSGGQYTLKWGNGGGGSSKGKGSGGLTTCANDIGWPNPNPTPQHGFVNIGQGGNSNSDLRYAVTQGSYPNATSNPPSITVGMRLSGVPGNGGATLFNALQERVNQDTDRSSATYAQYVSTAAGNGRRVVTIPVGDPSTWDGTGNGSWQVLGFANFFLATSYSGSSGSICAYYIGRANINGAGSARSDATKVYYNVLFR